MTTPGCLLGGQNALGRILFSLRKKPNTGTKLTTTPRPSLCVGRIWTSILWKVPPSFPLFLAIESWKPLRYLWVPLREEQGKWIECTRRGGAGQLVKKWRWPSTGDWINTVWYPSQDGWNTARSGIVFSNKKDQSTDTYTTPWVNLESIMLSERLQGATHYVILLLWNAQNRQIHRSNRLVVS